MADSQPTRRRGAQPGNQNRLRHGFYGRDAARRRAESALLVPAMREALAYGGEVNAVLSDLNRSGLPRKKVLNFENRIAFDYFEWLRKFLKTADERCCSAFEPDVRSPGPRVEASTAQGSNARSRAPSAVTPGHQADMNAASVPRRDA